MRRLVGVEALLIFHSLVFFVHCVFLSLPLVPVSVHLGLLFALFGEPFGFGASEVFGIPSAAKAALQRLCLRRD
jgi:hypothetical protein